jgi:uncharacterized protein YecE (DUF72 family)
VAWAARTPAGFTFNVKAFSLFTQHPTRVGALPTDPRPAAENRQGPRLPQGSPAVTDQLWERFLALEPLRQAGKLGAILLQFRRGSRSAGRAQGVSWPAQYGNAPDRVCIEFRNRPG